MNLKPSEDYCPNCGAELAYYTMLGINCGKVFCPECEAVSSSWMSFPYRCKNCDSEAQYYMVRDSHEDPICWWCGGTEFYTPPKEDWDKRDGLKPGFYKRSESLPPCGESENGKHILRLVEEREEVRDPETRHLIVWPLNKMVCINCGVIVYGGMVSAPPLHKPLEEK
jgi:hypothetical protein